jgi:thiol-disulfide isomerase/thioredoxin
MRKKIFKTVICSIVFLLIIVLGIYSFKRIKEKKQVIETIQIFSDFCAFSIGEHREFCTKQLPVQPVIILFLHPECDFCQEEIRQLKENQTELQNVSILLVTTASLQEAVEFCSNQNLGQFNNMRFLLDKDFKISNYFDVNTIPSIYMYNNDKKLIFKHKGEIKIETLIKYLSE